MGHQLLTEAELRNRVMAHLAQALHMPVESIRSDVPLGSLRIGSSDAVGMAHELEQLLGCRVPPELVDGSATVDALCQALAQGCGARSEAATSILSCSVPTLQAPLSLYPTPGETCARSSSDFTPFWPVTESKRGDLYFYQPTIERYLADGHVVVTGHGDMLMFGTYSYLGLNGHPRISQAAKDAIDRYGTGTLGVRLLAGTLDLHQALERRIAEFKQTDAAITFSSGYAANISTIAGVVGRHDTVICDKLDHASIVDGCQLSTARFVRFRHNDMDHLEQCLRNARPSGRKLVVVDAVFSMDGDVIDLPEVSRLCRKYEGLLMVDEAHSVGVLGRTGHGIEEHFGLPPDSVDIKMGTLSKAIPSVGGYVAINDDLHTYLAHQARGYIYSGALPPAAAAAALAALDVIEEEPERVQRLQTNTAEFANLLQQAGFSFLNSTTAIFPIVCGDDWLAFRLARYCQKRGIFVQAIPYPVVPKGMARLRTTVTANHCTDDLEYFVSVLHEGVMELGGIPSYGGDRAPTVPAEV